MSQFSQLERELSPYLNKIRMHLAKPTEERKLEEVLRAEQNVVEAESIISALSSSLSTSPSASPGADPILKARRNKLQRIKNEVKPLLEEVTHDVLRVERTELFSSSNNSNNDNNNGESDGGGSVGDGSYGTDALTSSMSQLNSTTDLIYDTHRILAESESTAQSTLTIMSGQREQLLNATDNVQATSTITGRARMLLMTMQRRAGMQKMCLWGVIVALISGNLGILYFLFFHGRK